MAKGRHLKPEFWTDKNIVRLTPLARLLYLGLWNYTADCGHIDDEPIELKMRILPADNCDVDELLQELADHGRIIRKDGVLDLPKLAEHQKPDKRWFTRCDACKKAHEHDEATTSTAPPSTPNTARPPSDHHEATTRPQGDHAADVDVDVDLMCVDGEAATGKPVTKPAKRATQLPSDFAPSDKHQELATEQGVPLAAEFEKFSDHHRAKGSTFKDWDAALRNWLRNARGYGGKVTRLPGAPDPDAWMRRSL